MCDAAYEGHRSSRDLMLSRVDQTGFCKPLAALFSQRFFLSDLTVQSCLSRVSPLWSCNSPCTAAISRRSCNSRAALASHSHAPAKNLHGALLLHFRSFFNSINLIIDHTSTHATLLRCCASVASLYNGRIVTGCRHRSQLMTWSSMPWQLCSAFPRIRAIHAKKRSLSAPSLGHILAHPGCSNIHSLELPWTFRADDRCVELLRKCVSLTHLNFDCCDASMLLNALPQLKSLKNLELHDSNTMDIVPNIGSLHQCESLRSLSLEHLHVNAVYTLLSSTLLHLTSLSLNIVDFTRSEESLQLWPQCLAGLSSLTSLTFARIPQVDWLLCGLSDQVPRLTQVTFVVMVLSHCRPQLPSQTHLESLLRRPALHVAVHLRTFEAYHRHLREIFGQTQSLHSDRTLWRTEHKRLSELVQRHPKRMTLVMTED
jgi:hypothetical protein